MRAHCLTVWVMLYAIIFAASDGLRSPVAGMQLVPTFRCSVSAIAAFNGNLQVG